MRVKMRNFHNLAATTALGSTLLIGLVAATGVAQGQDTEDTFEIEEVVVTGSRRPSRSAAQSLVPIDVIGGEALGKHGYSDLTDVLRTQVVSLNVQRFVTNDGAVFQRPFTLRGLAPDQTLMLINGKRRHRAATIQFSRLPLTLGAQGPDLATIPSNAISQLEVLRDGAAAQYGSDAIAGVVNLKLSEESEGIRVGARYGQFYEGDGEDMQLQANIGMPLTDDGFFNVALEYGNSKTTSRGAQRPNAQALIDEGNTAVADPAQRWGNPDTEAFRSFFNGGFKLNDTMEAYFFGNYSVADATTGFFYRHPVSRTNVFASVPLTDEPGGERFSFAEIFPGGFSPRFSAKSVDWSVAAGTRGELAEDVNFDLSFYHGDNLVDYHIGNTVNPSLGPESPTEFDPGTVGQNETTVNLDLTYSMDNDVFASPLNVAGGVEYHREAYKVTLGDPASYEIGPYAAYIDPDTGLPGQSLQVGSNGFPGFSPLEVGKWDRWNYAMYLDMEADVTDRLSAGVAVRYEDFSDFGTTFNWKVSGRFQISDGFAIRGSANTGFRAPTPGQANVAQTSTNINLDTGDVISSGIVPPTNPVAGFFGAEPLTVEKSFNFAGGVVLNLSDLSVTIDYFNIELKDRISVSGDIPIGDAERDALVAAGVPAGGSFEQIRFFTNAFDTKTQGVDFVVTYPLEFDNGGSLDLMTTLNYTDTKVTKIRNATAINRERELEISDFVPHYRALVQGAYRNGPFSLLLRGNYYGKWTDYGGNPDGSGDQTSGAEWLVDLEVGYDVRENVTLTFGAENIFDNFPDKELRQGNINSGIVYPRFAPTGFNGGFWYLRVNAEF